MADVTNVKIGACSVKFNSIDLGHTKGGVTVNYSPEYAEITVDQHGNTPVDKSLVGEVVTITVPLAESQVANLAKAMPLGTLAGSGDGRVTLGKNAGARLGAQAHQLVLHPLANASDNLAEDVVIHKAVVHGEVEIGFNNEDERILEVEFIALVDTTKADGNWLGFIGDSTD
jgi:hypothetical protein